ncbi:MAG TPA: response regulator transcription factor [Candidatus Limnocylindria bacterium]|nr:response regulator transcription factor [Candidatus Limnocylindria bacterium]
MIANDTAPILVVDDDPKIVALVRAYLERDGFSVITAGDGRAALASIQEARPRLVVLDVMLPGIDGVALTRLVRQESDIPILMLSARGTVADRVAGIAEGADDYLPKPFSPAELVVRIHAILRRAATGAAPPHGKLRHRDLVVDLDRHEVRRGDATLALTATEFRLLTALVEAGGRVLTRDMLIDGLYGHDADDVLDRSIDAYVGRLRDKLGDGADAPRYIATVRGVGYRITDP